MTDLPGDLEILLTEVRKTIADNRQFLEKLVYEAIEVDSEEETETVASEDDLEEL